MKRLYFSELLSDLACLPARKPEGCRKSSSKHSASLLLYRGEAALLPDALDPGLPSLGRSSESFIVLLISFLSILISVFFFYP